MREKRYLITCHCILDKALDKIKSTIGNETFGDTKIFFDTDNKLPDYITLENFVIVLPSAIKMRINLSAIIFKKALYDK